MWLPIFYSMRRLRRASRIHHRWAGDYKDVEGITFIGELARLGGNSLRRANSANCIITVGRAFAAARLRMPKRARLLRREKRVRKRDWLILAIADRMQPIQVQKTLFKFAKESGIPKRQQYSFQPYDWGPCSFEIYDDLRVLQDENLIETVPSGRGWNSYKLTDAGQEQAESVRSRANSELLERLSSIRNWIKSRGFSELLQDVYEQYPDYATQSLFMK